MRGPVRVVIHAMRNCAAAANVVWNVFNIGHGARASRHVHRGDLQADAMPRLELVGGGQDLDAVLQYLSGRHGVDRRARELMERCPGRGAPFVQCPIGCLQPPARKLPLWQAGGDRAFSFPRSDHRGIWTYILEDYNPVRVGLINGRVESQADWADNREIRGKRLGQIAQSLYPGRLLKRHLSEDVGFACRRANKFSGQRRSGCQFLPVLQVVFYPLGFGKWPVIARAPLVSAHQPIAHAWLAPDSRVDSLQPMVVPAKYFVVVLGKGALQMSRTSKYQL